jgi:dTDP-4-dehydrorhamnose reductase
MKKPDALIIGASGQVGQALIRRLQSRGQSWAGTCHSRPDVDASLVGMDLSVLDAAAGLVRRLQPQAVYFPSGFTQVDACQDDPEKALRLNALAPERAAAAAAQCGAAFVFFSTDYIFGEYGGPYSEQARPRPLGVYGASKLEGEARVLRAHPGALILRTTVVYGPEPQGKNTVYQVLRRLAAGEAVRLPSDQVTTPTYNQDLAEAAQRLVAAGKSGTFNVAGSDCLSRADFAAQAAREFGFEAAKVEGFLTAGLKQKAARPLRSGLNCAKLHKALGWRPRGTAQGLQACRRAGMLQQVRRSIL